MKTEKNILIAFLLNSAFSVFEFFGGIFTGSVAIISDAVHDMGDAASIGISYLLEKKSRKQPDEKYTYGYTRFSVMGGLITTLILLFGSAAVIVNSVDKIIHPDEINCNGMIVFAVIGVCVNLCAAFLTHKGDSINQKAVNLHMLEDVLGWIAVLIGAIIMRFTDITVIDPVISIGTALFIIVNALRNMKEISALFLEKTPCGISVAEIKNHILEIEGVIDVHHIHIRSIDGQNHLATMHIITDAHAHEIKEKIRDELKKHGIIHITLEFETTDEHCHEKSCCIQSGIKSEHLHHHHKH